MSHVIEGKGTYLDLDVLADVARDFGAELVRGQRTYAWYGHSVGDYPIPAGMTAADLGKCEHAIRLAGCEYEIGLVRRPDGKGFSAVFDFWGPGLALKQTFGEGAATLMDAYNAEIQKRHYQRRGYRVTVAREDGAYVVKATR